MVQLNGSEGESFCAEVARRTGVKVIKAIHVASAADVHAAESYRTDFHLFDKRGKGLWGGTGESFDWELLRGHRSDIPEILAGGLRPDNVAAAVAIAQPFAVDVASGVEAEPGRKDHAAMAAFFEAAQPAGISAPMSAVEERFGPYGGRYVPETLIAALDELTAAWDRGPRGRRVPRPARAAAARLHRPADAALPGRAALRAGRLAGLPEARGPRPHRRRTRSTTRSARRCWRSGWASRGSSPRPAPASTASPPPPPARCSGSSASSTWAPRTSAARRPNVERMKLLGAEVAPVEAGARTLKEAVSAAIRDWVANVETTHYVIGSAVGPAPYPALVRDLQRVIGEEAREQALAAEGALPAPGDRLRRRRLQRDRHLRPLRRRRRGRADRGRGGRRGAGDAAATAPR